MWTGFFWLRLGICDEVGTGMKPLCSVQCNFSTPSASVLNSVLVDVKTLQSCDTLTSNSAFLDVFKVLQILFECIFCWINDI